MLRETVDTRAGAIDAVETINGEGDGCALILCEHAAWFVPDEFDLGLRPEDARSHAAWDPGARGVALCLSQALDAPMVAGRISRLVYDCNRPPDAKSAMPEVSELIDVPGNDALTEEQKAARVRAIYRPFLETVDRIAAAREQRGLETVLITVHSFTPVYFGKVREVEIGILHDSDSTLADAMLGNADVLPHRRVARNQPYGPADGVTHSLQRHGIRNGFPNVMIEIRNDLLASPEDERVMAGELLKLIRPALAQLEVAHA